MCAHFSRVQLLTLCNPMDYSPPASSVPGILQARILEWVAIPFSRESSQTRDQTWVFCIGRWILWHLSHQGSPVTGFKQQVCVCMLSCFSRAQLFATLWTIALQAPLSMGFSRQEYWSELPCLKFLPTLLPPIFSFNVYLLIWLC